MQPQYFNPGCALSLYRPGLEQQILVLLNEHGPETRLHKICCHHDPQLPAGSCIINVCAGCDRRFRKQYPGVTTVSLWEVLDQLPDFPFPDYGGRVMSIQDPCPVRDRPAVHQAVRSLLNKMHITLVEPRLHSEKTVCCGDVFYPSLPMEDIHALMRRRAADMPCEDVVVYCVSCIKAMHIGGKQPRYLLDLLFDAPTDPQEFRTAEWHRQVNDYITQH